MSFWKGLNFGLGGISLLSDAETRSICAENPDGAKGGGATAAPERNENGNPSGAARELGKGWKVRPCISLEPGRTVELANIDGPGVVQHIWITVGKKALASLVLRMYWDGEKTPSVEAPLGHFFCSGFPDAEKRTTVNSLPICVNPDGGFNSYWPMPFRKNARITIESEHHEKVHGFFYQITYALTDVPENSAYFHAQYRRSLTTREVPEHVILDGVTGQGHYVGTYLAWNQFSNGWWGEGELKWHMDGDTEFPTICGTGTEDYFGGAWCFKDETYSTPFLGYPERIADAGGVPRHGLYRWHILDPIRFKKEMKVTVQALGWWPGGKYQPLTDDISSVAYWYQTLPHGKFPELPDMNGRLPR
jgi:hypothetical protein